MWGSPRTKNGAFSIPCFPIGANVRSQTSGQGSPAPSVSCAAACRSATANSMFVRFTRWCKQGDDHAGASACSRRKRGNQRQEALGRSRRGFSTKIPLRTDAEGRPRAFELTMKSYDALIELGPPQPDELLGEKGYEADAIRNDLQQRRILPVIPPKSNRTEAIEYDRQAYQRGNLIERSVNTLKQFRRIATCYEKTARAVSPCHVIGTPRLWIKTVNTA
jgi:transposase